MDNVIDRSRYPLPQQRLEAQRKRRMGLGHTGVANALEAMGLPYGSPEFLAKEDEIMAFITNKCYQASAILAGEKGSFPLYDEERYMASQFVAGLWDETKDLIRRGRTHHCTTGGTT